MQNILCKVKTANKESISWRRAARLMVLGLALAGGAIRRSGLHLTPDGNFED
jgi:hypothetical protein